MAHYAFLDANNVVVEVIVGVDEAETIEGIDPENWYGQFRGKTCKRTSYNTRGGVSEAGTPFRKNYASIGFIYDPTRDAFIPPAPEGNYILDEDSCLWVRAPELGIIGGNPIIASDGLDFVTLFVAGAAANSTQGITINSEPVSIDTNADGYGEFELSSDTPGLLLVEWGGFSLEIAAL